METDTLPSIFKFPKKVSVFGDHRCKIGAALIYKGRAIGMGWNHKKKSHPIASRYSEFPFIHAELHCILNCRKKEILKDCTLVTFRQLKKGGLGPSRPCEICLQILNLYNIKHIFYTVENGWKEEWLE